MMMSEIVQRTIELAQAVATERNEKEAGRPMVIDLGSLPPYVPGPADKEFKAFLRQQTVAVIYTVSLIMYLGRKKGKVKGLLEEYYQLRADYKKPDHAIEHMLSKVYLVEHLKDGVQRLQKSGIDINALESVT